MIDKNILFKLLINQFFINSGRTFGSLTIEELKSMNEDICNQYEAEDKDAGEPPF